MYCEVSLNNFKEIILGHILFVRLVTQITSFPYRTNAWHARNTCNLLRQKWVHCVS